MSAPRVAIALAGTDRGRSGIGVYVRAILPRLGRGLRDQGGRLLAFGTRADLDAYAPQLDAIDTAEIAGAFDRPLASAAYHLGHAGRYARARGAGVLLLPAANRRSVAWSPLPTVSVVHDLAQLHVAAKYDRLRMLYAREVIPRTLGRASLLVAVSTATRDDLARALAIDPGRIRVVPNGVDHERYRPDVPDAERAAARAAVGLATDEPYLLYTSRLEAPGKNHARLLAAFARSHARARHRLLLVGPDWGAEATLRALAASLGIADRVRFAGWVDDAHLPALVAGADAALALGLHEGFGLPALEALSAGTPVVVSRAGALPEVVGPLGVLCDPLDEEAIRQGLDRVLSDEALRGRIQVEGPRWAAARSWNVCGEALLSACRDAAAARGRR